MSIEQALAENTAAIQALVGVSKELLALRTEAVGKVEAIATTAASAKATKPAKEKDEAKPNISASPEDRQNPYEGIKDLIADYITGTNRTEERDARKEKMKALLNHEKIKKADVEKATAADHIMESAIDLFKSQVAKLVEKGDLTEAPKKPASDDLEL